MEAVSQVNKSITHADPKTCRQCNGTGKIQRVTADGSGIGDCWLCGGSGSAPNNGFPGGLRVGLRMAHYEPGVNWADVDGIADADVTLIVSQAPVNGVLQLPLKLSVGASMRGELVLLEGAPVDLPAGTCAPLVATIDGQKREWLVNLTDGLRAGETLVAVEDKGELVGTIERDALATKQFAQLVQLNILDTAETVTDTGGTGRALTVNNAATAPTILAGTGSTAAAVTDNAMQTQTETVAATVNAYSGSGSSGSFTVTGTITAGASRAYAEVGLQVTVATYSFLITHDSFSTLNVSSSGTLAVTYTITFS